MENGRIRITKGMVRNEEIVVDSSIRDEVLAMFDRQILFFSPKQNILYRTDLTANSDLGQIIFDENIIIFLGERNAIPEERQGFFNFLLAVCLAAKPDFS